MTIKECSWAKHSELHEIIDVNIRVESDNLANLVDLNIDQFTLSKKKEILISSQSLFQLIFKAKTVSQSEQS